MNITLWGTRGSIASPGPMTNGYGGNTSCVEVRGADGDLLILDAGTGIRALGRALTGGRKRYDILLTHLHMDHLQGLGFFGPLYNPNVEVHIWGPAGAREDLASRLGRYLSPPLFPVQLRDFRCALELHELPGPDFQIGQFSIHANLVKHPGPTLGYRIQNCGGVLAYIPDHEPILGVDRMTDDPAWLSGASVAREADLLIHDAQYSCREYPTRVGWGHSSVRHAVEFAERNQVKHLVLFHHDPAHTDEELDRLFAESLNAQPPVFPVTPGREGATFSI